MFIKLTTMSNNERFMNVNHISEFQRENRGGSVIAVIGPSEWVVVKETPEQIIKLINEQL